MIRRPAASPAALRAEGLTLATAGAILLGVGFPLTLLLAALALSSETFPPLMPALIGAPPIVAGYIACHYASVRLAKARAIENER